MVRAADTAPELMELGESKAVSSSDNYRIRVRQGDATFNNRRAGQNRALPVRVLASASVHALCVCLLQGPI